MWNKKKLNEDVIFIFYEFYKILNETYIAWHADEKGKLKDSKTLILFSYS